MRKLLSSTLLILGLCIAAQAQYTTLNAHSHNDYSQKTPFFLAYNAHFGSIEADIWAIDGGLFVSHNRTAITPERTLDSLYIQPIVKYFKANSGKAWGDHDGSFQLLIDLKTEVIPTLPLLIDLLKKYPTVFDPSVNKNAIHVVITGNRPEPVDFNKYPSFIFFDGHFNLKYDAQQLKRIALYSENLRVFTSWNGKEAMKEKDEARLKQVIDSVHSINNKVRFWNSPDTENAWNQLKKLKVDYINTDHIQELADYLNKK